MTTGKVTQDSALERVLNEIEAYEQRAATLPVAPTVTPGEIRDHLARYDFGSAMPLEDLVDDVVAMMRRWSLHVNHPRYFGLFNPSVRRAGIVADALVALYNPQLAAWAHAPAGNEIERHTLAFLMRQFGMDPDTGFANFTSGGQEANLTAAIAALTHVFPDFATRGLRSLSGQPTLYLSGEGHHSFLKVAHMTGLGRDGGSHDVCTQFRGEKTLERLPRARGTRARARGVGKVGPVPR
jgi:glutamate/tyrosine decarboxylase-like PLP-dependent enzyme